MSDDKSLLEVADLCAQARAKLGKGGTMRLRTLLDMVLVELEQSARRHKPSSIRSVPLGRPFGE